MLKGMFAAVAAIALLPAVANATVIENFDGESGSFSTKVDGDFSINYTFDVASLGLAGASFTSTYSGAQTPISFTEVLLNGTALNYSVMDKTQWFQISDLFTSFTTNVLTIVGNGKGSFGGSVSFDAFGGGGDPQPAVPEPATWAMMLAGFGLVGVALRSRSRTRVSYSI